MLNKIKRVSQNSDAKTLMTNFASLSVLKLIGYIFPLLTLPYLSRVIGAEGFGEIAFAASIVVYFQTITDFGFDYTATRDMARIRDDKEAVSRLFSNVLFSKMILMLFCALLLFLCIEFIPFLQNQSTILWLTFLYIPGYIIFPEWFFQAQEKMVYITIMNFISKLLFTVLVFVVIKTPEDYVLQPLLTALGFALSGIVAMWFIFTKFGIRLHKPNIREILKLLKEGRHMFISLILPNLYSNLSVILLRSYVGGAATGIYSNGNRFIALFDELSRVVSRTFYPFLARRIEKHNIYVLITGATSVIASVALFLSADLIVDVFYTPEFDSTADVIRIMAISLVALFLVNAYGPNYLVINGQEKLYSRIIIVFSIFGMLLTWYCTVNYSFLGVAFAITLTRVLIGVSTWYFAKIHK